MKRLPHAVLFAAATLAPAWAQAELSGSVALYSEYEYRGIAQTSEKPALQLSLDYAHASGFYVGTFVSNIKWLKDVAEVGGFSTRANVEVDVYGGFKTQVAQGLELDVGYLRYQYPRSGAFDPKPNTDEAYVGLGYGPVSVKYSYAFSDLFGVPDSKGSDFIEANVEFPVMEKLTLNGHLGHQRYKRNTELSYTVWKLGATYDFGNGLNAGAYVKGTDAEPALWTVKGRDWSDERVVAFVSYSF